MQVDCMLVVNSLLFGVGLAVDAFLVALANGMHFPNMTRTKNCGVAAMFSFFQMAAVMVGWAIAHTAFSYFSWIEVCFSWIAVAVLAVLGIKMLVEAAKRKTQADGVIKAGVGVLIMQCAATSVDALTVGFTVEEYGWLSALLSSVIISAITFAAYFCGVAVGKKFGMKFEKAASIVGGAVFIAIAVEIIVTTYL